MADAYAGPKFDHANLPLMKAMLWIVAPLMLVALGLNLWEVHKGAHNMAPVGFVAFLPIFVMGLKPHWQLAPEGVVDLRQWKKKQLIAPYDQIESVRTLKRKGATSRIFEIVTPLKTYKVDVLQSDEFLAILGTHLPAEKLAGAV